MSSAFHIWVLKSRVLDFRRSFIRGALLFRDFYKSENRDVTHKNRLGNSRQRKKSFNRHSVALENSQLGRRKIIIKRKQLRLVL